jgi:GTP1/Obg family GTP-binding protein
MSVKEYNIDEISEKYNKIIDNYESINSNLQNIFEDIKTLENIHNVYINSIDMSSLNYSIYVDDIKHQINIIQYEHEYINKIFKINIEKLYRDLFKLYNKVTKIIITIFKENKDTFIKIWNSCEKSKSITH